MMHTPMLPANVLPACSHCGPLHDQTANPSDWANAEWLNDPLCRTLHPKTPTPLFAPEAVAIPYRTFATMGGPRRRFFT